MNDDDKLAIINELIKMRSKVLQASMTMKLNGEDATALETAEQKLEEKVQALRSALHQDWQGAAQEVRRELTNAKARVQRRIRDIEHDIKRAEKAVEILGQVEGVLTKLAPLLG
jgi:ABC-type transporter Mla subunit MlaD